METPLPIRLTAKIWGGALLVFGLLGLIESARDIVGRREMGQDIPVWTGLLGNMPWWLLWALLLPVVLWLVTRFPVGPPFRFRFLLAHLVAGIVLGMMHGLVNGALYWFVMAPFRLNDVPVTTAMFGIANRYLFMNLLTYGCVVGVAHSLAFASRLRERELAAARLEQAVTAARLDVLRMELNPHFLFNTLNAISGLIMNDERETAVRVLARLGELLRLTLRRGEGHLVPLEREMELVQLHMELEQIRFRDRLTVQIDFDPAARTIPVPTLILQPLVENAFRYGVAPHPGPGSVTVDARMIDGRLQLTVEDSGPGFNVSDPPSRKGVGIANVRARLASLYGERASLEFRRVPGGFCAIVTLTPDALIPTDAQLAG